MSSKVVVRVSLSVRKHRERQMYAARLAELELTAYGRMPEDAVQAVKMLFRKFVDENRRLGVLEERLNQVGVTWAPFDEYHADDGIAVEDITEQENWIRPTSAAEAPALLAA